METRRDILLNGEPYELEHPCTATALLERLGLRGKPVVVELNKKALLPSEWEFASIVPGDSVEIVSIVAGG